MSLAFESATRLAARIRSKELSSKELTEYFVARIEKHDVAINAVVVRDFERALEAAAAADAALARGAPLGPLHGVPVTVKESFDLSGTPTTWGVPAFARNLAESDAAVVAALRRAGAHFLGKTNVPLQLGDFQSYNEIYGTTRNPWDPERTPGGSSGGSAAALAAGLTAFECGSDIGGSIRNPAHFCGVYGHKPTYGVVPDQGHALPGMVASPDIAVCGPMARGAEDLALGLDLLASPDRFHAPAWRLELPRPAPRELSELRIALWPTDPIAPVATEVADRVQQVGDLLARLGARVSDTARPAFDPAASAAIYLHMLNGVLSAGFPDEVYARLQEQAAALEADDRSLAALSLRSAVQSHRDWVRQNHQRSRLRLAWRDFFRDFDLLVCPIMPTAAFPHDHSKIEERRIRVDGSEQPYLQQLFWAGLVTVAYLPSTAFPTGLSREGLPIGLQAVGAEFADHTCIQFARWMANEIGGFATPPGYGD
jgi:amidase